MGEENIKVLVKSEKISQKKKKRMVWAISILLIIVTMAALVFDYVGYKKGQEFGLACVSIASEIGSSSWINENDSYAEQCKDVYNKLNSHTHDLTFNGVTYDASGVRKAEDAVRSSFADLMESEGFDRYGSYHIADWFKYTNIVEYFSGYYWNAILPLLCYIVLLFSIVFTILVNREEKKELVVYEDSILCRVSPKKSKQLVFEDINNIDFGKNTLKLSGVGVKFKITNLTNAESIKSVMIEKKQTSQAKSGGSYISNADELKKYKDLLDSGVISQNEFDAKKKQILGL